MVADPAGHGWTFSLTIAGIDPAQRGGALAGMPGRHRKAYEAACVGAEGIAIDGPGGLLNAANTCRCAMSRAR